jgi:hypothetical protein
LGPTRSGSPKSIELWLPYVNRFNIGQWVSLKSTEHVLPQTHEMNIVMREKPRVRLRVLGDLTLVIKTPFCH